MTKLAVPYHKQNRDYTCGSVCLRMVLEYCGVYKDEVSLTRLCGTTIAGTSLSEIAEAAERLGFLADWKIHATLKQIKNALKQNRPVIVMVDANLLNEVSSSVQVGHMIVVLGINGSRIYYHDPETGRDQQASLRIFVDSWLNMRKGMVTIWQKK